MGYRIDEAVEQLKRYGGSPDHRIVELLEVMTNINDDLWHSRDVRVELEKARRILSAISAEPNLMLE